jgi:hypothetical protein
MKIIQKIFAFKHGSLRGAMLVVGAAQQSNRMLYRADMHSSRLLLRRSSRSSQ